MRRIASTPLLVLALAGPTVLAFFTGGYFDMSRIVAALLAWLLVLAVALTAPVAVVRNRPGLFAVAALALLTAWTAISFSWAALTDPASGALERLVLYLGALIVASALLQGHSARWTEPALAAGTVIVVGYGLAGRMLPGIIHESASVTAAGRLEQPLTYWNAIGALAAIGLILTVRVAGHGARPEALRVAAAAGSVILAVGLYLSFSRGALASFVIGAVVLLMLAPTAQQLRALAIAVVTGGAAAAVAGALDAVRALKGSSSAAEQQGAAMLVVLVAFCILAASAQWVWVRRQAAGDRSASSFHRPRHVGIAAAALASLESNRYGYWRVALADGFAKHPLLGVGAGGFGPLWLRYRDNSERVRVAHSLYVETLAELGLVGFALLAAFFGAIAVAARRAYVRRPELVAGATAATVAFAVHSAVDWDWEMPALTLVAVGLAGMLLAAAEDDVQEPSAASIMADRSQQPGDARLTQV
jgi:O-antigen ligase